MATNYVARQHLAFNKWTLLEITFFGLCLLGQEVSARILVYRRATNQLMEEYNDMPAQFGPSPPANGIKLFVIPAIPGGVYFLPARHYACESISKPPRRLYPDTAKFVAIIQRGGNCTFELKVRNAQAATFHAAVIYNNEGDDLEQMSADNATGIRIPSVFVGQTTGENLLSFQTDQIVVVINDELPFNINTQLILPFSILIGLCFFVMIFYMIYKCIREERRLRRNLLPKRMLKKLPILKYTKNCDIAYETCVICLDEFAEGDKLRVLPCRHPYHSHCIDQWLTENRRNCPICKRKVFTKGKTRTRQSRQSSLDSVTDTDDDTTPLLQQPQRHGITNETRSQTNNQTTNSSTTARHHGTFRSSNNSVESADDLSGLSGATLASAMMSDDENALLSNDTPTHQARRINPFDRSPNLPPHLAETLADGGSRSIWNNPIFRLFRRRQPISIQAAPFYIGPQRDIEGQHITTTTTTTATAALAATANNILNPNLSGSFKDNNSSEGSSSDMPAPHQRSIYEPTTVATVPPVAIQQFNNLDVDSMFIQTPTQGGIGVVALPNTDNDQLPAEIVQIPAIEQDNNNAGGHQRYRRGFLF